MQNRNIKRKVEEKIGERERHWSFDASDHKTISSMCWRLGQIKQETKKENLVFKSRHLRIIYVKKEKNFYLFNLIEKIIYCFKNNDNYFWILKCRVLYTIFFLYFYFAFLYFSIFPSEFHSLGDANY